MPLSRRQFLSAGAASALVVSGTHRVPELLRRAAAQSRPSETADRTLVVLQLTGGNDGLNTIVPYGDDLYGRNRFATRIPASGVLPIDEYLGFHPSLASLRSVYDQGQLAIIQGVGYPRPNRSHFESLDIWHTALLEAGEGTAAASRTATGWLGRYLDAQRDEAAVPTADIPAVHLGTEVQPLALAGLHVQVPSVADFDTFQLQDFGRGELTQTLAALMTSGDASHHPLLHHVQQTAQAALASSRRVRQATAHASAGAAYPSTPLGHKLATIAQLIGAGLSTRIYYLTLDGFDTHSVQAPAHADLLRQWSEAVVAFLDDLTARGCDQRVAILCFSEFGRRVRENASGGTDHGAAAPAFLLGPRVRGGLHGSYPSLADLEDGDLKFQTDFRSVYATLLEEWLGVASAPLLGGKYKALELFGST